MWGTYAPPGLYQRGNKHVRFPVKKTFATLSLSHGFAGLRVTQHFRNKNEVPIECVYCLHVHRSLLLRAIKAKIGEKEVKFALKQKEKAKEDYSDAIAEGRTAFLVSSEEKDQLHFSIGLFPAESDLQVTLKLAYPMEYVKDHWEAVVSKAFFPVAKTNKRQKDTDEPTTPFDISISDSSAILSISSSTHSIKPTITGTTANVQLLVSRNNTLDFCVEYRVAEEFVSFCKVEKYENAGEYCAMLAFRSVFSRDSKVVGEYVFMLDRSGSMEGASIKMVQEAMVFLLKSLPEKCKFNIVSFGSSFELLFPRAQEYTDESVAEALSAVKKFKANMGGTNLLPALTEVLSQQPEDQYPRNIVMLTDGCVEQGKEILKVLNLHKKATRFHAIGLGHDVSEKWLQEVSQLTSGGHEVITQAKDLSAGLVKFIERVLTPSMTGLEVLWPTANVVQAPAANSLRNVYEGDVMYVYAHFGAVVPSGAVTVSYFDTAEQAKKSVSVPVSTPQVGKVATQLWAKAHIADLESLTPVPDAVAEVSLKYRVLSSQTAYFAAGEEAVSSAEAMATAVHESPRYRCKARLGVGGFRGRGRPAGSLRKNPTVSLGLNSDLDRGRSSLTILEPELNESIKRRRYRSASRSRSRSPASAGSLQWLIERQSSSGYWELHAIREVLRSVSPPEAVVSGCGAAAQRVWATLQAVFLFVTRFLQDAEKTKLIVRKAKAWLQSVGVTYEQHHEAIRLLGY